MIHPDEQPLVFHARPPGFPPAARLPLAGLARLRMGAGLPRGIGFRKNWQEMFKLILPDAGDGQKAAWIIFELGISEHSPIIAYFR